VTRGSRAEKHGGVAQGLRRGLCALAAAGALSMALASVAVASSPSAYTFDIWGVGTTPGPADAPGVDYSQIVSSEPFDFEGSSIEVSLQTWWCEPSLPVDGQEYTFISTTGGFSGTFDGVPDGSIIRVPIKGHDCDAEPLEMRIDYHRGGEVQTVTGEVVDGSSTQFPSAGFTTGRAFPGR
jgi:hypothetical protein